MIRYAGSIVLRRSNTRRRSVYRQPLWTRAQQRLILTQLVIILALLISIGLIFVYLWQSVEMINLSKQISANRLELEKIKSENEKLEFEVNRLFSVPRIRQLAIERLGMVEAGVELLYIPPAAK